MGGSVAKKEDFNLWDVAIVDWAPKDLEQRARCLRNTASFGKSSC